MYLAMSKCSNYLETPNYIANAFVSDFGPVIIQNSTSDDSVEDSDVCTALQHVLYAVI